jgi:hypothetical protein
MQINHVVSSSEVEKKQQSIPQNHCKYKLFLLRRRRIASLPRRALGGGAARGTTHLVSKMSQPAGRRRALFGA